jgi:23S rRNA C2498 (ribose-2'-O)-methylase RlmM
MHFLRSLDTAVLQGLCEEMAFILRLPVKRRMFQEEREVCAKH